ncbi:hypothetical protein H9X85_01070 [Anaerotignum lactatifermentans]|uniref:DUF3837 domain-containing protein n=1 Tax=Anaerotignum lactatifermentans TaxID=160404 RepID=A0ABS2G819_9FIRM|nr:DUF6514 family protein [Anaerotignum lactatifermentans]MBM6828218.1 hypothetical protein [Anaerotignum lactatifermentans]MBM6876619.1 hypothetical protein [Anaerotignum lactatifermentans]MBM6949801.1 hypothetical protein [Anaerotignum lactatifermentans]
MEQTMIEQKQIADERNRFWTVRYWLLACPAEEDGLVFGAAIDRCNEERLVEREEVPGLSRQKEDVLLFLERLSRGDALPVELMALADDYISEREVG